MSLLSSTESFWWFPTVLSLSVLSLSCGFILEDVGPSYKETFLSSTSIRGLRAISNKDDVKEIVRWSVLPLGTPSKIRRDHGVLEGGDWPMEFGRCFGANALANGCACSVGSLEWRVVHVLKSGTWSKACSRDLITSTVVVIPCRGMRMLVLESRKRACGQSRDKRLCLVRGFQGGHVGRRRQFFDLARCHRWNEVIL